MCLYSIVTTHVLLFYSSFFFQFAPARFPCSAVFISAVVAHGIIKLLSKNRYFILWTSYVYKHIFLNFGVISFTNKAMVSFSPCTIITFSIVYLYEQRGR